MNDKLRAVTLRTCKAILASPVAIAVLTEVSKNGPILKKQVIEAVWWKFPNSTESCIIENFIKLVKMGLILGENIDGNDKVKAYSINAFFIRQSIDNLKEIIGVDK